MGSFRQIVLLGWVGGFWLCLGCTPIQKAKETVAQTVQQASHTVSEVAKPSSANPATQMLAVWQSELQSLPDPTQDGKQTHGLPGQIFLLTSTDGAAQVQGDITIAIYDETDRPNGQPSPHKSEVWHITSDVLQRCVLRDERLGQCYVVFIPWNPSWVDVKKVRISTRYDIKGQPNLSLTAKDRRMVLERQALAQVQHSQRVDARGAPDPNRVMAALASGQVPGTPSTPPQQALPPSNPVMNTGYPNSPVPIPGSVPAAPQPTIPPAVVPNSQPAIPPQYQPIVIQRGQ